MTQKPNKEIKVTKQESTTNKGEYMRYLKNRREVWKAKKWNIGDRTNMGRELNNKIMKIETQREGS